MNRFLRYAIILSVLFTVLTLTSSIYGLLIGETMETHSHILSRFLISTIGVSGIGLYDAFRHIRKIVFLPIHYALMMSLVFFYVFVQSLFTELHPTAYRDIFFNFSIPYIAVATTLLVVEHMLNKRNSVQS
jgi:UDP-N-acetylmuramyl pentapeptide phosphotransferase/UDP-N-acetylglucosamine-1-phosphate transferase